MIPNSTKPSVSRHRDAGWRREVLTNFLAKRDVAAMQQSVCEKAHSPPSTGNMMQDVFTMMGTLTNPRPVLALKLATEGRAMRDIKRGNMATCACQVVKYL